MDVQKRVAVRSSYHIIGSKVLRQYIGLVTGQDQDICILTDDNGHISGGSLGGWPRNQDVGIATYRDLYTK